MRIVYILAIIGCIALAVVILRPNGNSVVSPGGNGVRRGGSSGAATILQAGAVTPTSYKGKVVLLDFWATWCGPCRESLPHTQELSQSADVKAGKLVVLTINMAESESDVRAFLKQNNYTFDVMLDPQGAVANQYGVEFIPNFVILDKTGKVTFQQSGVNEQALDAALKKALAK